MEDVGVCSGSQVVYEISFGYLRPEFIEEWIESEHNKTPYEVTEFSSEYVYWKCLVCDYGTNGEWFTKVADRSKGRGCLACANKQKESKIATECKKYFKENYNATLEYKLFKNPDTKFYLKCDIYIPNNIFIEINGGQHYKISGFHKMHAYKKNISVDDEFKYQKHLDNIKKEFCENNGIYIEVDLRKIKTTEDAIEYIENILRSL